MADRLRDRVRNLSGRPAPPGRDRPRLIHAPRLLVLDEPTVGLDIASRRGIVDHVHRLSAEDGVAVLWATHLIDEVHDSDTVVVLDRGRIKAHGSVAIVNAQARTTSIGAAFEALTGMAA
jgi:ABC-2 type transport system ATP-binding protein